MFGVCLNRNHTPLNILYISTLSVKGVWVYGYTRYFFLNDTFSFLNDTFRIVNQSFRAANRRFRAVNRWFRVVNRRFRVVRFLHKPIPNTKNISENFVFSIFFVIFADDSRSTGLFFVESAETSALQHPKESGTPAPSQGREAKLPFLRHCRVGGDYYLRKGVYMRFVLTLRNSRKISIVVRT